MILVCHVIFQDHMFKALCDLMGRNPLTQVAILSNVVAIATLIVGIFLVCHVILQDHVTKASSDFLGRSSHGKSLLCQAWRP